MTWENRINLPYAPFPKRVATGPTSTGTNNVNIKLSIECIADGIQAHKLKVLVFSQGAAVYSTFCGMKI